MSDCTIEPRYCPECGKELSSNASICNSCGSKLKKENTRSNFFSNPKDEKEEKKKYKLKPDKKLQTIVGLLICNVSLPYIILTSIMFYYGVFFIPNFRFEFIVLSFFGYLLGLGLIYYSIQTKYRGIFLVIFGYFLFVISFFISPIVDFNHFRYVMIFIFIIDLPILIMVFLGIQISFTHNKYSPSSRLSFIPLMLSNIFFYCILIGFIGSF
jgi:hypothetical protein